MTDIKKAIAELREAMDKGEGSRTILTKFDHLRTQWDISHRSQELNALVRAMCIERPFSIENVNTALTALESAVDGGTVEITGIDKAAEEIADDFGYKEGTYADRPDVIADIAAIIRQFVKAEVK